MELFLFIAACIAVWLWIKKRGVEKSLQEALSEVKARDEQLEALRSERDSLQSKVTDLSRFQEILDAEAHARSIVNEASSALEQARMEADQQKKESNLAAKETAAKAEAEMLVASSEAKRIIADAQRRAEEIAGEAYTAMARAKEFAETAQAMKNIIEGYGDNYIVPTYSLLDDLAEDFGHTDAGQRLKQVRDLTRTLVKQGQAATCEYVEDVRKRTAIRFVIDAFNGKVDSILSRSKADNHGKLEQEIRDAYALVNNNGAAFRNARVTDEYLNARLAELKWAATAQAIRDEEREQQRQIREQIREEEKALKEIERALKEAAKEEETIKKAMEKVQQQVAAASESQKAEYEAKLRDLEEKLKAAEEKNQRALSMAQQTRTGHVYIISNVGSFGEDVFKIGMTRRLEPRDRVRELGDASVPFDFDVHAMIFSEDAPGLERQLHRYFLRRQMNKVNPRKEFFKTTLTDIRSQIDRLGIQAHWTMAADAIQYRESVRIEQQIRDNPAVEAEWTKHQMELDPVSALEEAIEA